ncbi:MAG: 2,3,4,5-tetrahydropyridine-2,6-dicarboxylate N-succinyltransferase [Magnetococcales bacterium]|nr:2,3,4,5-tetrahydropyridine-2,6-dicarboxylate N-succinyltransferase [Magnetococcales bacterium]
MSDHARIIDDAWENRVHINPSTQGPVREAVLAAIEGLDNGTLRVAEKRPGHPEANHGWIVDQRLKKAVLLFFKLHDNVLMGHPDAPAFDKVPLKCVGWDEARFRAAGFRMVPPATVRKGSHIASGVVLMPSYVNIGAHVESGTMIDTWATVGSCAQIGRNCHISGGAGIGGVLEPLQANPVIIEDDCFIGARAEVAEGVIVQQGSVLSMGVYLGRSTPIVDRASGTIFTGHVPPYSVVVPGTLPGKPGPGGVPGPGLYCAVIVKTVDANTRAKTAINELLRE